MRAKLWCNSFAVIFGLLIAPVCPGNVFAQQQYFDKIHTREGEAHLSVRQVMQDNNGVLWLATFSGLYCYNGGDYIFEHRFRHQQQINADVTAVVQDETNNIWIGTNDGLAKYNPESEELVIYRNQEGAADAIGSNKIRSLAVDEDGRIWVGTFDQGLYLYLPESDGFRAVRFDEKASTPPVYIRKIFAGDGDRIWLGTWNNGAYCFTYKNEKVDSVLNFREESAERSLSNNFVYEITKDTDGTMVIGTRGGLNVFNSESKRFEDVSSARFQAGDMTNFIRSIMRDNSGKLWIGTWGGLILCDSFSDIKTGEFQLLKHKRSVVSSISHSQVMDVFQDKSGVVWVATENGLNSYDPYFNQFQPLSGAAMDDLSEQTATDFFPYKNSLLFLTLADGIIEKKNGFLQPFASSLLRPYQNEKFYSLFVDSENNIWLGSFNGVLLKLNVANGTVLAYKHSEQNTPIYAICELRKNVLAIGTFGEGLKYFNVRTGRFSDNTGISGDVQINDMLIDSEKRLWIVTQFGIFKKDELDTSFEYFLPENNEVLHPNVFLSVAESKSGTIFIGGRNGLYEYQELEQSFVKNNFDTELQLWVTNLQFDSENRLWMNLNFNKIAQWNPKTSELLSFNVNNGIRSSSYNRRGFYIDKNDQIYLSGFDQVYMFDATQTVSNTYAPPPVFTNLVINNTDVHTDTELNDEFVLDKNIAYQKRLVLSHRNKDFSLSFSSSSYLNTRENKYKYRLQGIDREWHIGNERSVGYTNLRPGNYTFEVYSANNDGLWSAVPARLQIKIKPAPLLSTAAIMAYIFILAVAFYFSRRLILTRMKLRRALLVEKVKRDKEEKFHEERLRFYTNISHELRTPLTLIMGPAKELLSGDVPNSESSRLHQLIFKNSQRLLSLVNQLLDFRKSLHQGMTLKVTPCNLVRVVESNMEAFAYMANEKHIQVDFESNEPTLQGWFDVEKLDIILFNILSNAFKYTPDYGFVKLGIIKSEGNKIIPAEHVKLTISNTGKGIPKHLQEKVFERFFQVTNDSGSGNSGTGIGLALVKNVVELHHGKITVQSEPGESTTFSVYLPMHKQYYSEEEVFDFARDADRRTRELFNKKLEQKSDSVFEKKNSRSKTLLIVEDNAELRAYLQSFLSESYTVYAADNGQQGLECCKKHNPDLVISDIMMDTMDGIQFCKTLKSTPEISHIPVILMTALASVENKLQGYKVGADDYITKPFEPELLQIRIENTLEHINKAKKEFGKNPETAFGDLTVSKIDEDFLNQVIDLIDKNLDNGAFDIESFAKNLGVSTSQLYRKIKGISGVSPNEFIRTYRLRQAAKMIVDTRLSMSEVAYKVGFNDSLYFSKCFKKQFGVSPSKYKSSKHPPANSEASAD